MGSRLYRRLTQGLLQWGGDPNATQPDIGGGIAVPTYSLGNTEKLFAARRFAGALGSISSPAVVGQFSVVALYGPPPNGLWIEDVSTGTTSSARVAFALGDPIIANKVFNGGDYTYWVDETLSGLTGFPLSAAIFQDGNSGLWSATGSAGGPAPPAGAPRISTAVAAQARLVGVEAGDGFWLPPNWSCGIFGEAANTLINVNVAVRFIPWAG